MTPRDAVPAPDETPLERDLRLLQQRFGPPQPRAPLPGQLPLLRVRAARRRRTPKVKPETTPEGKGATG